MLCLKTAANVSRPLNKRTLYLDFLTFISLVMNFKNAILEWL